VAVAYADQAADYLALNRRKLVRELVKRPVARGGVPFIRPAGFNRYLFLLSDLDAWIERWHNPNGGDESPTTARARREAATKPPKRSKSKRGGRRA
jgi:excisionase family DNA binding protein